MTDRNNATHKTDSSDTDRLVAVAFKAILRIAEYWAISDDELSQLLGGVSRSTVHRWQEQLREQGTIQTRSGAELLDRAGHMLSIYKVLHTLFVDPVQADDWVRKPNRAAGFDGMSALERMMRGQRSSLQFVRRYLEGQLK